MTCSGSVTFQRLYLQIFDIWYLKIILVCSHNLEHQHQGMYFFNTSMFTSGGWECSIMILVAPLWAIKNDGKMAKWRPFLFWSSIFGRKRVYLHEMRWKTAAKRQIDDFGSLPSPEFNFAFWSDPIVRKTTKQWWFQWRDLVHSYFSIRW